VRILKKFISATESNIAQDLKSWIQTKKRLCWIWFIFKWEIWALL